jgi:hypothetical protein
MAGGPSMAKPPTMASKRNSEAVKDEVPKMDLGGNPSRRLVQPSGGAYVPSAGSYVPSAGAGSYNPSSLGDGNRLKRGSVPTGR